MKEVRVYLLPRFFVPVIALALSSCGSNSPQPSAVSTDGASAAYSAIADDPDPIPPKPEHNYTQREGDVYYYGGAISRDAADAGQVSPQVYAFRYLGGNYVKGNDAVLALDSRGMSSGIAWCARPCEIIHMSNGQMLAYDARTIIGAVFQDIMDGKLEQPQVNIEPAYRATTPRTTGQSSIYQDGAATANADGKPAEL